MREKTNKALHNTATPDEAKMRFLYDSKTPKVKKSRGLEVLKSKTSKVQKLGSSEVKKSQTSKVANSKTLEVKESGSSEILKLKKIEVKKFGTLGVQDSKASKVPSFESPEVQNIKTHAKYETFKKLTVLFSNKDIDTLAKFEREIMQNRDLKTERITKNSILRCLVKILPLIKFNKNKIPDENILMDRILKALEKKLNSQ